MFTILKKSIINFLNLTDQGMFLREKQKKEVAKSYENFALYITSQVIIIRYVITKHKNNWNQDILIYLHENINIALWSSTIYNGSLPLPISHT